MKAHQLLFQNVIDINPRTGIIKLHSLRMALVSTEAMGILRRDLVSTLGMERAKGFLMRYGWACGYHDGEAIQKMFDWDSKKELLFSGPFLHTLEGIVTVEPDILEFDDEKLYFTGYWLNSYEVEEHIRHFGTCNTPVCWTLVGYASGFLTKVFGKQVLVREKHCAGKKDDYCYYVAKTIDQWKEEEREDIRYYQAENLVSELDRVYNEIEKLNQMILHAEEIDKKLTNFMLEGKSLSFILGFLADVLDRSVVIEKGSLGEILEACFKDDTHEKYYKKWKLSKSIRRDVNLDTFELMANGFLLGKMVVIGNDKLEKHQHMIIERAINVCIIQLFHQRAIAQSIWKKKEDFLEDILEGTYNEDLLRRRAHDLDIRIGGHSRISVIQVSLKEELENVLSFIVLKYPHINAFLKRDSIVLILYEVEKDEPSVYEFLVDLKGLIEEKFKTLKVYISSGRAVQSLTELGKSYQDALQITRFLQLAYPSYSAVATFEQLEPITLFLKCTDQEELIFFCKKTIGKLIEYDQEQQANFLLTLKTYLDLNGNLYKTAQKLHLSISGLRYRLNRIEELCGIDLKDSAILFKFQLAVQIYFTLNLLGQKPFL
ncbi:XylR N-terminal domain-containing protein [Thermoflavimicrobium dichotomicum]|uniref:V4R domain-containing protein n=1 Tax=Thermoflavimicrobium dichotomicum TaxID=46223 RepID=A0A1I3L1F9_9BACL|nr:XylR N-terminal domain-containing protein [Thermoflavimicrobium dichotomicum]SFI78560.1 V4R domain-containing protein [Thermoflavimicrobium dichotomicum]